ncbi:unnamed protein product [Notodromas monacha]|uniref:Protein kinase domain-containing protein n=1 Tax=Notodromas monacha TaxID=399045 RepID=A0A7R9BFD8_9CRUS|nr:unnamed protein product [Notodromas monacha]CAG0914396.1 unnamed protein product [Notodromas monacha]
MGGGIIFRPQLVAAGQLPLLVGLAEVSFRTRTRKCDAASASIHNRSRNGGASENLDSLIDVGYFSSTECKETKMPLAGPVIDPWINIAPKRDLTAPVEVMMVDGSSTEYLKSESDGINNNACSYENTKSDKPANGARTTSGKNCTTTSMVTMDEDSPDHEKASEMNATYVSDSGHSPGGNKQSQPELKKSPDTDTEEIEVNDVTRDGHEKATPEQFELLKVLGQGSFGKVFLVKKIIGKDKDTLYAMKVLKKATLKNSPGIPASANAHDLFRGFSFVAPSILDKDTPCKPAQHLIESKFIQCAKHTNIQDDFEILEKIGQGSYSICKRCVNRQTKVEYAIKIVPKDKRDCREEVDILRRYGTHQNVVTLHSVYEDSTNVYLVLELMKGGELFDKIVKQKFFSEREAASIMQTLASTVAYLHQNGVQRGGVVNVLNDSNVLNIPHSHTPFATGPDDTPNEILKRIGEGNLKLNSGNWASVVLTAFLAVVQQDLVSKMLHIDPAKRPSAAQVVQHSWITNRDSNSSQQLIIRDKKGIKGALNATFRAISQSPKAPNVGPVGASALARRRGMNRPQGSTEV